MKKIKVMSVLGTRPEAIKMAPLIRQLQQSQNFVPITVVTAQHREMLDQVLTVFKINPDYDLNVMQPNQSLAEITSRVLTRLDAIMSDEDPDIVLVHGDTTTTFAASLSAFYHQIPVGHVEAGLRTWDKYSPYPEEMNRQLTDSLADLFFAPTPLSRDNLIKENRDSDKIIVTGNTAIDALKETVNTNYKHPVLDLVQPNHRIILLTMHRRENQGNPMISVFKAVKAVVERYQDVDVVFPVHLSPKVFKIAQCVLDSTERVHLTAPLDVIDFHNIVSRCYFVMTDSGGIQEEAPSLNKPVLVLRQATERPEGVTAGTLKLVGTQQEEVEAAMMILLDHQVEYQRMAIAPNPYGDGHAVERILQSLQKYFANYEE
ncbi:non-hydrolyzing UDP-N-acetylglucosamine 2-epimerase [Lactiplantibacillus daoliensis]|uniref:UDP-N-acetylglucosamine 2-epimerase (non-hydrolyzing) n=1 Tax=Lactiplantibacillus daoliensis TaxID=2559916 RepID=A0ABW1UFQ0_9LACO|nr:UDP-N-acetylglucosamine 2-epimerase (non-hydrolyzing) [Lactiplantibacillus daoliensis]